MPGTRCGAWNSLRAMYVNAPHFDHFPLSNFAVPMDLHVVLYWFCPGEGRILPL